MFELCAVIISLCIVVLTIERIRHDKILRETAIYQFNSTIKLDGDILDILDGFIENIFNEHLLITGSYNHIPYINEKEETKLRETLIEKVSSRMSVAMYQQLTLYYNEKAIPEIIGEKLYALISLYVEQHNNPEEARTR